jgi:hypothetical protein
MPGRPDTLLDHPPVSQRNVSESVPIRTGGEDQDHVALQCVIPDTPFRIR